MAYANNVWLVDLLEHLSFCFYFPHLSRPTLIARSIAHYPRDAGFTGSALFSVSKNQETADLIDKSLVRKFLMRKCFFSKKGPLSYTISECEFIICLVL